MKFYNLKCEVPGGLGPDTIYDRNVIPWTMKHPHVILDGWLGGELLSIESCLFVSHNVMNEIMFNYSGIISYQSFQLEKSTIFQTLQPTIQLPHFKWLKIANNPFKDDIAITFYNNLYNQLIISDKLWQALSNFELGNYSIKEAI